MSNEAEKLDIPYNDNKNLSSSENFNQRENKEGQPSYQKYMNNNQGKKTII